MKKVFLIVLIIVFVLLLTACNGYNKQILDFNYNFTHAYVKVGNTWTDVEVEKWVDYEGEQLQLTLKDGTVLVVSSMNCILYEGTLPETHSSFCSEWDHKVLVDVCKELNVSPDGMVIEFVSKEYVAWLACEVYTYQVTLPGGEVYYAGARENEDGFYCDVWED